MARASVQHLHMDIRPRTDREAFEEIVDELGLQVADPQYFDLEIDDGVWAAAEIDRGNRKRLVHGHDKVAGAVDAAAIAERLRHGFAERDAEILHRMVLIDIEVPSRLDAQVEGAVAGDELEHVVEKTDAGRDLVLALALEHDRERDLGLGRAPVDHRAAHSTSSITAIA